MMSSSRGIGQDTHAQFSGERLLLTTEEAADILHVGRTTVYALIRDGRLRAVHIGRSCRLSLAELHRYVAALHADSETATGADESRGRRDQSHAGFDASAM